MFKNGELDQFCEENETTFVNYETFYRTKYTFIHVQANNFTVTKSFHKALGRRFTAITRSWSELNFLKLTKRRSEPGTLHIHLQALYSSLNSL